MSDDNVQRAPYPGLRAFRREETDLFFGREDCINAMVDRLAATRFLAVLGSSGTGKSSLVKTGLLDALELGLMANAGSRWRIVDFRPGGAPMKNLARRLLETEDPDGKTEPSEEDVSLLRAYLMRGPRSIIEWCRSGHLPKGTNLLLLVDQFEELFRYPDYAGREEAEAFVAMLLESAHAREFPIYAAITMRSEYLGACALIEGLADAINAGMFLTPRMTRDQCREAITGPAEVCDIDIEPGLVNRLLNDLANFAPWDGGESHDQLDRIMRRADQLPLLQYTLNRMWLRAHRPGSDERITLRLADYEAIGGLGGALNAHADQIFEELGKDRWPVIEWVFRALTAGTTIADAVRRPTRFDDLVAACGGNEPAVRAVVDAFRAPGVNFLVPEYDPKHRKLADDAYVDISHESLIRQWKKLSGWLEQEARAAQQWRRLNDRFGTGELLRGRELANLIAWRNETRPNAAWAKRYGGDYPAVTAFLERSNRAQTRKRVLMIGTAAAVFVLMAIQAVVATFLYRDSQKNLILAQIANTMSEVQRSNAEFAKVQAEDASRRAEKVALEAEDARRVAENERLRAERNYEALTEFLEGLIFNITQRTKDAEVNTAMSIAQETLNRVRKLSENNPSDNELKRYLTVSLTIYGDVKLRLNDVDAAAKAFDENLELCRVLVLTDPTKTLWQDDLALALERVAQMRGRKDQFDESRKLFEEALEITRKLVEASPGNDRLENILQIYLGHYGDMLVRAKDLDAARKAFDERLDSRRKQLLDAPDNDQRMENVADALGKVGDVMLQAGSLEAARGAFEEELEIYRKLYARDANRKERQESLVASLNRNGDLQRRMGNIPAARKAYEESIQIDRKLAAANPGDATVQFNLQSHIDKVAGLLLEIGDIDGAKNAYAERLATLQRLIEIRRWVAFKPHTAPTKQAKDDIVGSLGTASWAALLVNRPRDAAIHAEEALKLDAAVLWIDINRAHAYLLTGRTADARKIYDVARKTPHQSLPNQTYLIYVKEDFTMLRKLGISTPEMAMIEKDYGI
ncbi:MAG: hypothetical protein QOG83_1306 [Alphaproteobacteria bacterium]|nr:hypothetical protein [Alphaproteobacteria bacterium]